jgi:hypothetical protein
MEAGLALGVEAGNPAVSALAGDAHRFGHVGHRHLLISDPPHKQASAMEGETGVTVTHEDLRVVKTAISTAPEVFSLGQRPVTNVQAGYS